MYINDTINIEGVLFTLTAITFKNGSQFRGHWWISIRHNPYERNIEKVRFIKYDDTTRKLYLQKMSHIQNRINNRPCMLCYTRVPYN